MSHPLYAFFWRRENKTNAAILATNQVPTYKGASLLFVGFSFIHHFFVNVNFVFQVYLSRSRCGFCLWRRPDIRLTFLWRGQARSSHCFSFQFQGIAQGPHLQSKSSLVFFDVGYHLAVIVCHRVTRLFVCSIFDPVDKSKQKNWNKIGLIFQLLCLCVCVCVLSNIRFCWNRVDGKTTGDRSIVNDPRVYRYFKSNV